MICFFESVLLKEGERTLEKLTAFITSGGFVGSLVVIALTALVIMLLKKLKKSYISRDGVDGKGKQTQGSSFPLQDMWFFSSPL